MNKEVDVQSLLENLAKVIVVLDFPKDKEDHLVSDLLEGVFMLAMANTVKIHPEVAEKYKKLETDHISFDKLTKVSDLLESPFRATFAIELESILDSYITEISMTVSTQKKQQILALWKSHH